MIDRKEVEEMLSACERDRIGPHPSNETLAALCRAWLALDGAVVRMVGDGISYGVSVAGTGIANGSRVRIVPEDGKGVGNG